MLDKVMSENQQLEESLKEKDETGYIKSIKANFISSSLSLGSMFVS